VRLGFTEHGWPDYTYWLKADRDVLRRINRLLEDVMRDPYAGIGKPEPLKHALSGAWSRRIDDEHRLVYLVDREDVVVLQARRVGIRGDRIGA
jgi:toxin YoeB